MSRKILSKPSVPMVNIAVLGKNGSGKSAIVVKYLTRRYIVDYWPELEDKFTKLVNYHGERMVLNIFDTFDKDDRELKEIVKWSDIILIVYSIVSRASFYRAREILENIRLYDNQKDHTCLVLVANKSDLERSRLVPNSEGENLAREFQTQLYECTVTEAYDMVENLFRFSIEHFHNIHQHNATNSTKNNNKQSSNLTTTTTTTTSTQNSIPCPVIATNCEISSNGSAGRWMRSSSQLVRARSPKINNETRAPSVESQTTKSTSPARASSVETTPKKQSSAFRFFKKPK